MITDPGPVAGQRYADDMPTTAEDAGLSTSGLERARAHAVSAVERRQIAGAVLVVARHDQVAQVACVGLRDVEAGTPMEPDTIFRIASMTKPIVCVGAMMLVEAGALGLDDAVSRYIPEFARARVFAGEENGRVRLTDVERPITVQHLLSHTSGLAYDAPHPELAASYDNLGDKRYELPELMRRLSARPLAHQPGRGWTYGWSHDVLGRVMEIVADQPVDDYLESRVFTPLDMVDTGFYVPPEKVERLATVYESVDGRLHPVSTQETEKFVDHTPLLSGGGGLVSTATDYLRFTRMLSRRGELDGARLLAAQTVDLMTRNHLSAPLYPLRFGEYVSEGEGYGLGFGVIVERFPTTAAGSEGTYGWGGSWTTEFWIDPVKDLTGIFMAQVEPFAFDHVGVEIRSLVYQALSS
jgi:CubicO group peptidase (beta-lactamase class C family)